MADFALRAPSRADAAAIATVCNEQSGELYDAEDVDERAVGDWFGLSDLGMFLVESGGEVVGYADVRRDHDGLQFPIDLRVSPTAWGRGVTDRLLDAAEGWAREHAEPGAVLRGFVSERDAELQQVLVARGYRPIRHSFLMEIALPERPEPPQWQAGISVRTYDPARDEQAVYECHQETFADHWDFHPTPIERWREFTVESALFDSDLWWLAESEGALAAISLNAWHFSGDPTFGWVGVLGVRRPWRRRGLGLALLQHSFADFKQRGAVRVGLGVDGENLTGAVRLYERAGMRQVRRTDTFERRLDG